MNKISYGKWITTLLDLDREPVGVKFLLSKEDYQALEVKEPSRRISYCSLVSKSSAGEAYKFHKGHMACSGGSTALGLEKPTEEMLSGERRLSQGAYNDLEVCKKVSSNMKYCQHDIYGASVMPLEKYNTFSDFTPDVIIFICNPFTAMRIIQSYAYKRGHASNICVSGMQAICQESTSLPYINNQLNISLMCSGTRLLAKWENDEMAIGIPYNMLGDIVEGLRKTVNPLERNPRKRIIEKKLKQENISTEIEIIFNKNYDDKCYIGGNIGEAPGK